MNKLTYRQWMKEVEFAVEKRTGLGFDMLLDWLSRDAYEDGESIDTGVKSCLEQIGFTAFENELLVDEA